MLEAFGWGFLAQSSLLVAGLVVWWVTVPTKLIGILGGFGASWGPTSRVRWWAIAQPPSLRGGLLAMLTNSLMPFSFERGGALAGAATAVGFCLSVLNS